MTEQSNRICFRFVAQSVRQDNLETGNVTSGMQAMPYIHHKLGAGEEFLGVFVEIIFVVGETFCCLCYDIIASALQNPGVCPTSGIMCESFS